MESRTESKGVVPAAAFSPEPADATKRQLLAASGGRGTCDLGSGPAAEFARGQRQLTGSTRQNRTNRNRPRFRRSGKRTLFGHETGFGERGKADINWGNACSCGQETHRRHFASAWSCGVEPSGHRPVAARQTRRRWCGRWWRLPANRIRQRQGLRHRTPCRRKARRSFLYVLAPDFGRER